MTGTRAARGTEPNPTCGGSDLAVALASTRLDFRGDPADEIIAATSVVHDVPLRTRDEVIRGSGVVPTGFVGGLVGELGFFGAVDGRFGGE